MKHFLAIESAGRRKGYSEFLVYRIKKNNLDYVGSGMFRYGLTMGPETEVMKFLVENKCISKKFTGYYETHLQNPVFKITYKHTRFIG